MGGERNQKIAEDFKDIVSDKSKAILVEMLDSAGADPQAKFSDFLFNILNVKKGENNRHRPMREALEATAWFEENYAFHQFKNNGHWVIRPKL